MKRKFIEPGVFDNDHQLSSLELSSGLLQLIGFLQHFQIVDVSKCSRYLRKRLLPSLVVRTRYKFPKICADVKPLHMSFPENSMRFPKRMKTYVPQLISACVHFNANFKSEIWKNLKHLGFLANQSRISLPPNLEKLTLGCKVNTPIDVLPASLKILHVGTKFLQPIVLNQSLENLTILSHKYNFPLGPLPNTLKHLRFNGNYNQILYNHTKKQQLPDFLESFQMSFRFNQSLGILPNSLLVLKTNFEFNQDLGVLPNNLQVLHLDCNFSFPLDKLPDALTSLKFGNTWRHTIDELPINLQKLVIGKKMVCLAKFPKSLKCLTINCVSKVSKLPPSLESLTIRIDYRHKFKTFPQTLKHLNIWHGNDIVSDLPNNLETLRVYDHFMECKLPNSLIMLTLDGQPKKVVLPPNLKYLYLGKYYTDSLGMLPNSLRILKAIGLSAPLDILPENLKFLTLGNEFNSKIILPKKLRTLKIGNNFNQPIDLSFHLRTLHLGNNFNQSIELPTRLKSLHLGDNFNQPLELPQNLEEVNIGNNFNQRLTIPKYLTALKLGTNFIGPLGKLPKKLKILRLGKFFDSNSLLPIHRKILQRE
jgi:hypothetical protein